MGTKIPALLSKDKGGFAGSGLYATPPKGEVKERKETGKISIITHLTGSQPTPSFNMSYLHWRSANTDSRSVDENTVRRAYEADRDAWIRHVTKNDPRYFDDKKRGTDKTIAWLPAVKLTECP